MVFVQEPPKQGAEKATGSFSKGPISSLRNPPRVFTSARAAAPNGMRSGPANNGRSAREPEKTPTRGSDRAGPWDEKTKGEMAIRFCRTDCLQEPLSRALRALGASVGTYPWPYLLVPLVISGALSVGFIFLPSRQPNDLEEQFTPIEGPAKIERSFVQKYFHIDDANHFSPERLSTEGAYATLIAVAAGRHGSLLTREAFAELLKIDQAVHGIQAAGLSFDRLCARNLGICISPNPLLSIVQDNPGYIEVLRPNLTFPVFRNRVFLGFFLGGVTLGSGNEPARSLLGARAVRLIYFLQMNDPSKREASNLWLEAFLQRIPLIVGALNLTVLKVAYFTSLSRQNELENLAKGVIPLVSIAYLLTIVFSIISCARLDCVRTKLWVAFFGVFSAGLSVISSFGLMLFYGVPFVITAANSPFLILGIGVDDMFILVSCWQHTKVMDSVKDRMANTYSEAAVSVTITTMTDVLAFYIGIATSFPSIRSFCIYTGTAFIFCYIYNLTFLGAVLALNGRREKSNRHWLTFMKVFSEPQDSRGRVYNRCCTGGLYDETTGTEIEHPMNSFFRKYYGPFLMYSWTKVFVVLLFSTYLATSLFGCFALQEGIDLRNVATDDSYIIPYYNFEDEYFSTYGPRVMVIVTKSVMYWNPSVRAELEKCMKTLEHSYFVEKNFSQSWLRIYENVAKNMSLDLNDHDVFIANLPALFREPFNSRWDINISAKEIIASRFFIQTVNVRNSVDEKNLLKQLRRIAKKCKIPLMVYHPAFIHFDQYLVIHQNTIQNVLIAAGAMLIISLLLIPSPVCSLWVTFTIGSVIVGVSGYMAFWDVNLDSISMINLVICIGFSVDYSAHISYAYVSSNKISANEKAISALFHLGYPVLQASASTLVGVFVLSMATSYVFRTCFKIMFLVITFGTLHGLVFIPVFLTFFSYCT
ncbi:patched domain-containing protein 3 [Protobothrops mucrosquamatus]|uniref:patched domain-containing protein 3 n=1 Tax=Protobothrops mucrosquamatus TaxID=103944 RepID=UPI0007759F3B|nr:patched domain-containing protein 3 [Protobothrops mucrosquamatus]